MLDFILFKAVYMHLTEDEYNNWKTNPMPFLILETYFIEYLKKQGRTIDEVKGGILGNPDIDGKLRKGNVIYYRTDWENDTLISIKRTKEILAELKLPYVEFIGGYGEYVKSLS